MEVELSKIIANSQWKYELPMKRIDIAIEEHILFSLYVKH